VAESSWCLLQRALEIDVVQPGSRPLNHETYQDDVAGGEQSRSVVRSEPFKVQAKLFDKTHRDRKK